MPVDSDALAEIDVLLQAAYQPDQPGAAIIAVSQGQPVFRKGCGLANLEHGMPIVPDTVFRLAHRRMAGPANHGA